MRSHVGVPTIHIGARGEELPGASGDLPPASWIDRDVEGVQAATSGETHSILSNQPALHGD